MPDLKELKKFLVKASTKTYASSDDKYKKEEKDGSVTFEYKDGDWKYNDNYLGANSFGGREVIYYKDKPIWVMTYYGQVYEDKPAAKLVPDFLRKALTRVADSMDLEVPARGPKKYKEGDFSYLSNTDGKITAFTGEEFILKDGDEVYCAVYNGGLLTG